MIQLGENLRRKHLLLPLEKGTNVKRAECEPAEQARMGKGTYCCLLAKFVERLSLELASAAAALRFLGNILLNRD